MTYFNEFGQARLGWKSGGGGITPSTLWNSIYSVYNADSTGSSSLKTSLYAAYNGESNSNDSFGSNNGTAVGGLTYTTGKIGNAFNFNGTNSYVSLPNNTLNFTGDFSYSVWVNLTSVTGLQPIINNFMDNGVDYRGNLLFIYNNALYFRIHNSTSTNYDLTTSFTTLNTWVNIVVTRKSSTRTRIYINGNLAVSDTNTVNPTYFGNMLYNTLGSYYDSNGWRYLANNSKIDAVNVWNKELSASEITELYNSGNGAQYIGDNFYKPTTNDALLVNNGTAQGGLTYGVGKVGTAFVGNGTNGYVSLPNNSFNFTGSMSINMWVNISSSTTRSTFMGNYYYVSGGRDYGWIFEHTGNGTLRFYMQTAGNSSVIVSTSYSGKYNSWKMITVTKLQNSTLRLYIDGILITTNYNTPDIYYNTTNYSTICGYISSSVLTGPLENGGKVDAVGIWNRELSASEITELYNSGNGKQYPN